MWDNKGYEADMFDPQFKKGPPATRTTEIDNYGNMRGFENVDTKTPEPYEDEEDNENKEKKGCCKRFFKIMMSHIGLLIIVLAYLVMGGFLFTYLEVENEKSSCTEKYERYEAKQEEAVDRVYNIAQGVNVTTSKNNIEEELKSFASDVYTLSVDPGLNCSTIGTEDNLPAWNFANSLYFCATIVTTIGYGHISPTTKWGQIVCMIYSILGIPLMLIFLAKISEPTAMVFRSCYLNICCCKCFLSTKKIRQAQRDNRDMEEHQGEWNTVENGAKGSEPPAKVVDVVEDDDDEDEEDEVVSIPITVTLIILVAYILVGAAVFSIWEKEWTMVEGTYFSFITLSTIGFGDYVPGRDGPFNEINVQIELVVAAVYCFFGLALLSMCINLIQDEIAAKFTWIAMKIGMLGKPKKEEEEELQESDEESDSSSEEEDSDVEDGKSKKTKSNAGGANTAKSVKSAVSASTNKTAASATKLVANNNDSYA